MDSMEQFEDIYYAPEDHGLTVIGELDDPNACYSFDLLVVWQHDDGRILYGIDSGCSCPSPFEDVYSSDEFTEVTNDKWKEFEAAVKTHAKPRHEKDNDIMNTAFDVEKVLLLQKVSTLLIHQQNRD
jgi:hypothetical protein